MFCGSSAACCVSTLFQKKKAMQVFKSKLNNNKFNISGNSKQSSKQIK